MIHIEELVKDLFPGKTSNRTLSTLCLNTTNPVYLVFIDDKRFPDFVVHLSGSKEILKTHSLLIDLYHFARGIVPEPLICTEVNGQYVTIQSGLEGESWFQLAKLFSTPEKWDQVKSGSLNSLEHFQKSVMKNPKWQLTCNPGRELRTCNENCQALGIPFTRKLNDQVDFFADKLDLIGEIPAYPQHGDFCLNNLIVSSTKICIIDFEDFGITSMPLHDEFSLGLSFYLLSPEGCKASLKSEISYCIRKKQDLLGFDNETTAGLFLHHLLLRLGAWSELGNRSEFRLWLVEKLDVFLNNPGTIFDL